MKRIAAFLFVLALFGCALSGCGGQEETFVNPGDFLGGGGTGEIADSADDVTEELKSEFAEKDFSGLAGNISSEGANEITPTEEVVSITESGTYLFKGKYGGIRIGEDGLSLHLILDGAEIVSDGKECDPRQGLALL